MPANVSQQPVIIQPPDNLLQQHPQLKHMANDLAQKYATRQIVTEEALQAMGHSLWMAIEQTTPLEQARQQAGVKILPLVIESDNPAVQQLPWETLYHPESGFLGKAAGFTLCRRLQDVNPQEEEEPEPGPLRVLLFTTLPDDLDPETSRLNIEEEQSQVQEALMPWIAQGLVKLEMPDDGRFSTLREYLQNFQPHLLFLSGHGKFEQVPHTGEPPFGTFLFESETGSSRPIRDDEIAQIFIGSGVQCVVLSACESGKAASDELNHGLARQLGQLGIPHVVGMRESLLDRAGILFARHFCDAVARRERVDVALQQARQAITTPLKGSVLRRDSELSGLSELSLGQWCLPLLIAPNAARPLISWNFNPKPPQKQLTNQSLNTISLPPQFVGRRAELRDLKSRFRQGKLRQLLITGPGGQGKTALAGKLARDLQEKRGYQILAWSARPESNWDDFLLELELQLSPENIARYDRLLPRYDEETERATLLLRLLLTQNNGQIVLFFDNLESVQQPDSLALSDARLLAWIKAAQSLAGQGLILLLTSRWQLPGWPNADHLPLEHAGYGDFLQMARRQILPPEFFKERSRLHRVYTALHGNGRGLEFFAAAIQDMGSNEEDAFLEKLAQTEAELQTNMALAQIYARLQPAAQSLLQCLPVYGSPVPVEGIVKLALEIKLPQPPEAMLARLLAVSLVEQHYSHTWQAYEYQVSPLVLDWLRQQGLPAPGPHLLQAGADYQSYLYRTERRTLSQAITAHQARQNAGQKELADRFALDHIVGTLSLYGFFHTLLTDWLPGICLSANATIRATALGQTGKQLHHVGDYDTALSYLQQSLAIRQEIGDKSGEGATLNNMATTAHARGDYDTALSYLQQSLAIQKEIGDKSGEGTTLNNMATTAHARGDYDTALSYLQQSLAIRQEIGDKSGEGTTLNNISQIYDARGDYDTALSYLQQSLAIQKEIGDKSGEGTTLNNISQIYDARGDYDTALSYLQQSLAIRQEIGDKSGEGTTLNNISQIYDARGDYDTALSYLQQSLAIRQEIGDKSGEGTTLNNISQIYDARGDYDTALSYLQQSLAIRQEIGDVAGLCATLFNMGHIHLQNDEQQQAVGAWVTVYRLASQMNLAQALAALENLAPQLGLQNGLAGWEQLAQQMEEQ